jgi:hypothetical protein
LRLSSLLLLLQSNLFLIQRRLLCGQGPKIMYVSAVGDLNTSGFDTTNIDDILRFLHGYTDNIGDLLQKPNFNIASFASLLLPSSRSFLLNITTKNQLFVKNFLLTKENLFFH